MLLLRTVLVPPVWCAVRLWRSSPALPCLTPRPYTTPPTYITLILGAELRRERIPSRFTHDVVRAGDRVYVCDTGRGAVLELSFPSMTLVRFGGGCCCCCCCLVWRTAAGKKGEAELTAAAL